MLINTKMRYGLRVMIELAMHAGTTGLLQKEIAKRQEISLKYLDHIIAALRAGGLITTIRGKKSGYRLTSPPETITAYSILHTMDPRFPLIECLTDNSGCEKSKKCAAQKLWVNLNSTIEEHLQSVSLKELADNQREIDAGTQAGFDYHI